MRPSATRSARTGSSRIGSMSPQQPQVRISTDLMAAVTAAQACRVDGEPFGSPSTLQACAAVTAAIKSVDILTCGCCGLMLPILEDPVLAERVAEGRIKISDLLLYSS